MTELASLHCQFGNCPWIAWPPALPVSVVYPARRIASANAAAFVLAARDHFRASPMVPLDARDKPATA